MTDPEVIKENMPLRDARKAVQDAGKTLLEFDIREGAAQLDYEIAMHEAKGALLTVKETCIKLQAIRDEQFDALDTYNRAIEIETRLLDGYQDKG